MGVYIPEYYNIIIRIERREWVICCLVLMVYRFLHAQM